MTAIIGLPSVMHYRNPIIVAILLHVIIAGLFFLQFMHWEKPVGNKSIISSYIVNPASLMQSAIEPVQTVKKIQTAIKNKLITQEQRKIPKPQLQNSKAVKHYAHKHNNKLRPIEDHKTGDYSALLLYLHEAISEQQNYPADAALFGQQGTVQVQFTAYPDGRLEAIRVINSSGHASLDKAGLQAINNTSSLAKLKEYISQPETLSIKLVYQR